MSNRRENVRNASGKIRRAVLVVAVLALGAMAAISLRTSQAKDSSVHPDSGAARASAKLRTNAQQTPFAMQTGQIRPLTQEEAQKLAAGLRQLVNQSTDGLKSVQHPDGSVSIDLEGRFQSVAVARRELDGRVTQSCVDNPGAAAAFFGIDPQLLGVPANLGSSRATAAQKGGSDDK